MHSVPDLLCDYCPGDLFHLILLQCMFQCNILGFYITNTPMAHFTCFCSMCVFMCDMLGFPCDRHLFHMLLYLPPHPTPQTKQNNNQKKTGVGGGREGSGEYIEITPSVCLFVCHPVHVSRQYLLNCWTIFNESCLFSVCSRVTWRFPYSCQCHVLFFWCSHCPDGLFCMVWLRCLFECGMLGYWGNWFPDGPLHQLLTTLMCVSE